MPRLPEQETIREEWKDDGRNFKGNTGETAADIGRIRITWHADEESYRGNDDPGEKLKQYLAGRGGICLWQQV